MSAGVDPLERLVAIEAIEALKARYFLTLDTKDWSGLEAVFAPEAVMDLSEEMQHHGSGVDTGADPISRTPAGIVAFISGTIAPATTVHEGHMPAIELSAPDRAAGTWQLHDWIELDGAGFHAYGHYHDAYSRHDGRWLIESTRITRIRVDYYGT
jgi:hypothetical protein